MPSSPTPEGTPPPDGLPDGAPDHPGPVGVAGLLRLRGYRRLLVVRFATQWGDGMFQAALGGAVLFNPERQADPLAVAAGLAVLLLPYSVIGPFAGALLDRWDRRRVLVVANLLRAVLITVVAGCVAGGLGGVPLYVGALAAAGVSRFALSGLSVALPHVVPRRALVEANVLAVTFGSAISALGAASAIGLRALFGGDDAGSARTTLAAVVFALAAATLAAGFRRRSLGPNGPRPDTDRDGDTGRAPDRRTDSNTDTGTGSTAGVGTSTDSSTDSSTAGLGTFGTVLRGFVDGARAAAATPSISASFAALGAHRLAFGITTLSTLLLFRYSFTDSGLLRAGLPGIGEAVVLAAAGLGCAALLTPPLVARRGRPWTVRAALLVAAAAQVGLAVLLSLEAVMVAAFVLGLTGQTVKLCTDAAVQGEADDRVLGRVFALYDVVFNVGYVLAVAVAALLAPPDGRAPWLLGAAAALYVAGLALHDQQLRRRLTGRARPPTTATPPRPARG